MCVRSRERAVVLPLRAEELVPEVFSAVWTPDAPCRAAAAGCAALREGLEARTDRSSQKQKSPSGVESDVRDRSALPDWELIAAT